MFVAAHESGLGPSRRFAATQQFGRFRSEADIQQPRLQNRIYEYAPLIPLQAVRLGSLTEFPDVLLTVANSARLNHDGISGAGTVN